MSGSNVGTTLMLLFIVRCGIVNLFLSCVVVYYIVRASYVFVVVKEVNHEFKCWD